jgi:addiction module RelE/StbE family toxin
MWIILESDDTLKAVATLQPETLKKYEVWKNIMAVSGISGLRAIRGFRDEALKGRWKGYRSSRLSQQWRVIYQVDAEAVSVYVIDINAHDYRR